MRFKSLKARVLVWFGLVLSLVLLAFSFVLYYFLNQSINLSIQTQLYNKAVYIQEKILPSIYNNNKVIKDKKLFSLEVAVIKNGNIIAKTDLFTLNNISFYLNSSNSFFILNDKDEFIDAVYCFKIDKPFKGAIVIYKQNIDDEVEDVGGMLLLLNPILLLLLLFFGSKLIDKILNPVKNITKISKEVSITNFSKTIPVPKDDDEIKELVDSFNEMIRRLRSGFKNLDRFNSDVSHELRTPLTVIKGEIEITLRKLREPKEYEKSMKTIFYEAEQIQKMVESLLLLTKYSKENISDFFEICNLDVILLNIIDKYSIQLEEKDINLHIDKVESISIKANSALIISIFSNLLDNAIKYSKNGKNIYILLYKNSKIHFNIKDEGIGISKDNLFKITDRFYRADASRNKSIKGFGLGLSIVKNSVELHNGKLIIDSVQNSGTTVEVIL